jgi:hypothetical protein
MTEEIRIANFMITPIPDMISSEFEEYLCTTSFFTAPASTKYHWNYEGGLFDHSFEVMRTLVGLTKSCQLQWTRPESPYVVGMFHDLCKIDQYELASHPNDPNIEYGYRNDTLLKGHGDKSVMLLSRAMRLTEEEIMCIRYHMGAFTEKEEWRDYTGAVNIYPNVLWTHHADMIASHIMGI